MQRRRLAGGGEGDNVAVTCGPVRVRGRAVVVLLVLPPPLLLPLLLLAFVQRPQRAPVAANSGAEVAEEDVTFRQRHNWERVLGVEEGGFVELLDSGEDVATLQKTHARLVLLLDFERCNRRRG